MGRIVKRLGYTRKKISWRTVPRDLRKDIDEFCDALAGIDPTDIISLDETGFSSLLAPSHGYAPKGQRLLAKLEGVKRTRCSCTMGVASDGIVAWALTHGAVNKVKFVDFLDALRGTPQHYVLMDNIKFHHSHEVLEKLHDIGKAPIFTPPYSPEFNPIENVFSALKSWVRKDTSSRSGGVDAHMLRIHTIVDAFCTMPMDGQRYFDHLYAEVERQTYQQPNVMLVSDNSDEAAAG